MPHGIDSARPPTAAGQAATDLHRAMVTADRGLLTSVLAEDVRFSSPAFEAPTVGREVVTSVLLTAAAVYEDMIVDLVVDRDATAALFFTTSVSDSALEVCYRIDVDEAGRIERLSALMRPVDAVRDLVDQMMARLADGGAS